MNCTLETLDMAAAQMVACSLHRVLIDEPNTIALTVKSVPTPLKTVNTQASCSFYSLFPFT